MKIKIYGRMTMVVLLQHYEWGRKMKCIICEKVSDIKKGHNPEPVKRFKDGTCCDDCQYEFVMPARGIPYETSMKIKEYCDKSRRL